MKLAQLIGVGALLGLTPVFALAQTVPRLVNSAGPPVGGIQYCWINAATGNPAATYPPFTHLPLADPNHVSVPSGPTVAGSDFVRVPCPARAALKIPSKKTHAVAQKATARKSGTPAVPDVPSIGLIIPLMHRGGDGHCDDQMIGIRNMAMPCK